MATLTVVRGGAKHGEEQQQRHEQVRNIYGEEQQTLLQRLRAGQRLPGKLMEEDVTQDGKQGCGHVDGVNDGGSPDPLTAT